MKTLKSILILFMLSTECIASEQAYDLTPYREISTQQLQELYIQHVVDSKDPNYNFHNEIDEDWRIVFTALQEISKRYEGRCESFNLEFTMCRHAVRMAAQSMPYKGWMDDIPFFLFGAWKRTAWVHPDDAEALNKTSSNGRSMIRVQLKQLLKKGKVNQPAKGLYEGAHYNNLPIKQEKERYSDTDPLKIQPICGIEPVSCPVTSYHENDTAIQRNPLSLNQEKDETTSAVLLEKQRYSNDTTPNSSVSKGLEGSCIAVSSSRADESKSEFVDLNKGSKEED